MNMEGNGEPFRTFHAKFQTIVFDRRNGVLRDTDTPRQLRLRPLVKLTAIPHRLPDRKRAMAFADMLSLVSRVPQLDPAAIRAYVTRDWGRIRHRKRAHWQAHGSKTGLPGLLRAAEDLRNWMKARFPHWPTLEDREKDLETHRRVSQALASTSRRPIASPLRPRTRIGRVR